MKSYSLDKLIKYRSVTQRSTQTFLALFLAYLYSLAFLAFTATAPFPELFLPAPFVAASAFFLITSSSCYLSYLINTCQQRTIRSFHPTTSFTLQHLPLPLLIQFLPAFYFSSFSFSYLLLLQLLPYCLLDLTLSRVLPIPISTAAFQISYSFWIFIEVGVIILLSMEQLLVVIQLLELLAQLISTFLPLSHHHLSHQQHQKDF